MSQKIFERPDIKYKLKQAGVSFLDEVGDELPIDVPVYENEVHELASTLIAGRLAHIEKVIKPYKIIKGFYETYGEQSDVLISSTKNVLFAMEDHVYRTLLNYDILINMLSNELGLGSADVDDEEKMNSLLEAAQTYE